MGVDQALLLESKSPQLHVNEANLRASGKSRGEVLRVAEELARLDADVVEACSAETMAALPMPTNADPAKRTIRERLRLSFVPGRSGDLLLAFRPQIMIDDPAHVANHGHPHDPDRRVPLIFWGPWKAETRMEPVRIVDLAPTLAKELGIHPSETVDGKPLELSRRKP